MLLAEGVLAASVVEGKKEGRSIVLASCGVEPDDASIGDVGSTVGDDRDDKVV